MGAEQSTNDIVDAEFLDGGTATFFVDNEPIGIVDVASFTAATSNAIGGGGNNYGAPLVYPYTTTPTFTTTPTITTTTGNIQFYDQAVDKSLLERLLEVKSRLREAVGALSEDEPDLTEFASTFDEIESIRDEWRNIERLYAKVQDFLRSEAEEAAG